jgi:hypothetical protein
MIEIDRLTCCLALAAAFLTPASVSAHGGIFPAPPPSQRPRPSSPAPPPQPRRPLPTPGPSTPGPQGPSAPTGRPTGPSTPISSGPELTDWSWWWAFNEDPYVDLRRRLRVPLSLTGTEDFYIGKGMRPQAASWAPGQDLIQTRIGPTLAAVIDGSRSARLRAAALVGLAKLHPTFVPAEGTPWSRPLAALADPDRQVVQSAILALGLIAEPQCATVLCELLAGGDEAAARLKRSNVPEVLRVDAALAAGLMGARCENEEVRRYLVHSLSLVFEERLAAPDLHIACATAIGLTPLADTPGELPTKRTDRVPSAATSRLGQVLLLTELLEDSKRPEFVRAHLPRALALLARDAREPVRSHAKRQVLDLLASRKREKRLVRYGAVEALGILGDADEDELDVELRAVLRGVVKDGDLFERNLALLSIAYASSRAGTGFGEPLEGLRGEQVYLMKQFVEGQDRTRPWAALAIGLQGYHARAAGGSLFTSTGQALRWTLERTRSSADAGASCIALGLRRDAEAVPHLLERLESTRDDADRGRVAIALALAGATEAIQPLEEIVRESHYHPTLLRDASVALALLGDPGTTDELLGILVEAKSSAVRAAAVAAIGFVGDTRAVEPLLAILEDAQQSDSLRVSAATALGIVCEEQALPWSAHFTNRMNYTAGTDTLFSANATGFLDQN